MSDDPKNLNDVNDQNNKVTILPSKAGKNELKRYEAEDVEYQMIDDQEPVGALGAGKKTASIGYGKTDLAKWEEAKAPTPPPPPEPAKKKKFPTLLVGGALALVGLLYAGKQWFNSMRNDSIKKIAYKFDKDAYWDMRQLSSEHEFIPVPGHKLKKQDVPEGYKNVNTTLVFMTDGGGGMDKVEFSLEKDATVAHIHKDGNWLGFNAEETEIHFSDAKEARKMAQELKASTDDKGVLRAHLSVLETDVFGKDGNVPDSWREPTVITLGDVYNSMKSFHHNKAMLQLEQVKMMPESDSSVVLHKDGGFVPGWKATNIEITGDADDLEELKIKLDNRSLSGNDVDLLKKIRVIEATDDEGERIGGWRYGTNGPQKNKPN